MLGGRSKKERWLGRRKVCGKEGDKEQERK
jgi:hypothetical protein